MLLATGEQTTIALRRCAAFARLEGGFMTGSQAAL